jgi:glycerol-3-phosphate dehydrogenase
MIQNLEQQDTPWDIAVIGGGATGIGIAIDAASRGYRTVLFEQSDFGKGTSSRSTKLIHGGVRYLRQGNISLVLEALKERGLLHKNAPHLVHNLPFVVPNYDWWEGPFYGIGLKLYDLLAGKEGFGDSKILSREATIKKIPTIETEGLRGGVIYFDGQFDDARLVINMAETAVEQGATLINYMPVTDFIKNHNYISGVVVTDIETNQVYQINARVFINATGVFTDQIRRLDDPDARTLLRPSQGIHLVLDKSFLPAENAIMIPQTDDGRVLFAIPWHDRVIIGTTDTPVSEIPLEPTPFPEELDFLLSHAARYLTKDPIESDILSVFAGLRPLVGNGEEESTSMLSRDHTLHISGSGLLTITGGKWTTYRKMAEDTIEQAIILGALEHHPCITSKLPIHGYHKNASRFGEDAIYGSDAHKIQELKKENSELAERIHPELPYCKAEIIWAVQKEMARTLEDFFVRRTRALLLNARATLEATDVVASIMSRELKRDKSWRENQIYLYNTLAKKYFIS